MNQNQNSKEKSLFNRGWASVLDIEKKLRTWKPQGWAAGLEKMAPKQRAAYIMEKLGINKSRYFSEKDRYLLIKELKRKEYSQGPEKYEARLLREILEKEIK